MAVCWHAGMHLDCLKSMSMHSHRGMVRWHIMYNLVVLRLISFGMDLHWARRAAASGKQPPLPPPQQPSADQISLKVQ